MMGKVKLFLGALLVCIGTAASAGPIYFDFTDEKYTFLNGKQSHTFDIDGQEVLKIGASSIFGDALSPSSPKIKWTPSGLGIGGPFTDDDVLCEFKQDPFAVDDLCFDEEFDVTSKSGYALNSAIFAEADSESGLGATLYHDIEGEQNVDSPGELLIRNPKYDPRKDPLKYFNRTLIWPGIGSSYVLQGISIGIPEELDAFYSVPAPPVIWLFGIGLVGLIGFRKFGRPA